MRHGMAAWAKKGFIWHSLSRNATRLQHACARRAAFRLADDRLPRPMMISNKRRAAVTIPGCKANQKKRLATANRYNDKPRSTGDKTMDQPRAVDVQTFSDEQPFSAF